MRSTDHSTFIRRPDLSSITFLFLLPCLLALLALPSVARAAPPDFTGQAEEFDVKDRVARVSLIAGDVNLKRGGNNDWERVRLNFPLVEGDTISTSAESRAEIQIDARNFVRLGANSILRVVTLRDEGVALSVIEGTATIRLAKFDRDKEYFELDAPKTTLSAEKKGLYRVDVSSEGRVRLTARDGGRARIYSETSGFALREGRAAELIIEGANAGDWEFVTTNTDSWDSWVDDRERYLAERLRYDVEYYDQHTWGAEDLASYGSWVYSNEYGWIWRPHTSSISQYDDWAPYRYGGWVWVPPYGWTWVGNEPWGWAPYHYGRWVYHNGYWAWCPRSYYYHDRGWWRPALVAIVFSGGNNYCWYPLGYHQRDPRSRHYGNNPRHDPASDRLRPMRADDLANLRRVNPAQLRAVTAMAARDFGAEGARARAADGALAQRVVNSDPLRTDVPVRAARPASDGTNTRARAGSGAAARPARAVTSVDLQRPTGAATRNPGVALDEELRRSRVLNGREPRPNRADLPEPASGVGAIEARPTGAVERPTRTVGGSERTAPVRVPVRVPGSEDAMPVERPVQTERTDRPREIERPDRTERPERGDRPVRTEPRQEPGRVEQRYEPPVQYEAPKRTEPAPRPDPPPQRSEPAPRYEPPPQRSEPTPRYEPPPRNDPPPQRNDPPPQRNDPPPQRNDPPPQRNDPPPQRSEPQRSEPVERPSRKGDPR